MTRSSLASLFLVLALAAAGCGDDEGGGGGGAEDEITKVLQTGLTTTDPKVQCEQTQSESLMRRTYGSAQRCREIEGKDAAEDQPAKSVDVTGVKVDGGKATATVTLRGGEQDGAKGPLTLVEQDGSWRVDDLSPEFLRAELRAGLKTSKDIPEQAKSCLGEKILALPDPELRELAYGSIGERPEAQRQLVGYLAECDSGGGVSTLRQQFEKGLEQSMKKDGATEKQIECVRQALRKTITDEDIQELAQDRGENLSQGVRKASEDAFKECGVGRSVGSDDESGA